MSRAGVLQDQLNQSEASLSTALSQNAGLTSDLAEVNSLLAKVCFSIDPSMSRRIKMPLQLGGCRLIPPLGAVNDGK